MPSQGPGRALRRRALTMAYDDALVDACTALGVSGAGDLPDLTGDAHDLRMLQLEQRLRDAGLDLP